MANDFHSRDESDFFSIPSPSEMYGIESLERLGGSSGSRCELYLCRRAGKFRVLKCLKAEFRGDSMWESLLRKEFEIAWRMSHPNICECYAFVEHPQLGNCIEMEWVDGRSLQEMMDRAEVGPGLARRIICQICDALSYIHSKQICHRDLKPSNILVTYNGNNVKLIDFGLSDSDSHFVLKAPAGTLAYVAPEVLEGEGCGVSGDIYSLGKVIAGIAPGERRVIARCCKPQPEDRYSSAAEVEADVLRGRRFSWVLWALAGIAVMAAAAFALWYFRPQLVSQRGRAPMASEEPVPRDTVILSNDKPVIPSEAKNLSPAQTLQESEAKNQSPAPKSHPAAEPSAPAVGEDDLDKLFRRASEAFE